MKKGGTDGNKRQKATDKLPKREREIKYSKREERRGFTCQHGRLHNRMKNGDG